MKLLITFLLAFCTTVALAQLPKGSPYPFSTGWSRSGYYQADSATIIGLRDTSWAARFIGSMVFYRTATDTSLFIWNGVRWMGVAGTATPINPNDFIKNQFAAKETKRSWYDTNKVLSMYGDTIRVGGTRYTTKAAMEFNSAAAASGIVMFNRTNEIQTSSYLQLHWADTTIFEIAANGVPSANGKTITFSGNKVETNAYYINLNSSYRTRVANLYATNPATIDKVLNFEGYTNSGADIKYNQRPIQSGSNYYNGGTFTLTGQGATELGTNKDGGDIVISSGISTGSGSSSISFKTATAGASGNTDRTPSTKFTIKGSGVINVSNMPTSSAGLVSGDLWSDGGIIKIIP